MITGFGNTNFSSTAVSSAMRHANVHQKSIEQGINRLSSGYRVNNASEDAAALSVGSRLNTETAALQAVTQNISSTVSALQIADGTMARQQDLLTRMKVLAVQAGSDNLSDTDRVLINTEYQNLAEEVCRSGMDTKYSGRHILGDTCEPAIPFSNFNMIFRVDTLAPLHTTDARSDTNQNNNGLADAGEIVEVDVGLTNNTTQTITAISLTNAQVSNAATVTQGGGADGLFGGYNLSFASLAAGASGITTSTGDLDIYFAAGSQGMSFDISVDLNFTIGGQANSIRIVFGDATVGAIAEGQAMPIKEIIDLSPPDPDRIFDTRVGSGVIDDEDQIDFTFPLSTLGTINSNLFGSSISTKANADSVLASIDTALDTVITNRVTIGAAINRFEQAALNVETSIHNMSHSAARYLGANVAEEITKLSSSQARQILAIDSIRMWESDRIENTQTLLDQRV